MSFRAAYHSVKHNSRNSSKNNRGLIRDKTPEEEKKMMDDYYKRTRKQ